MSNAVINIPGIRFSESGNFLLIAGPCVVESEEIVFRNSRTSERAFRKISDSFCF